MYLKYRDLRKISRYWPLISSGNHYQQSRQVVNLLATSSIPLIQECKTVDSRYFHRGYVGHRYSTISESTISEVSHDSFLQDDIVSFIESRFDELQGPCHYWLNRVDENSEFLKKEGIFLVLAGRFFDNSEAERCELSVMFEKVKFLQQRFPHVRVMGYHSGSSVSSADQSKLVQLIMEEYLTFPILLSDTNFSEMMNGACYILLKDFTDPVIYDAKGLEIGVLNKAIEELNIQDKDNTNSTPIDIFKGTWVKQTEVIKEPKLSCSLQELFLYFPACISADESSNRLFLSDCNHHRIVICDENGKILDCIGSSPGFEDGEFESAKMARPAASFYHAEEDCLYIVDSENHAIRRADMQRRVLETLHPTNSIIKKDSGLWTQMIDKLGIRKDTVVKSEDSDSLSLMFPWHIMKLVDHSAIIINRSFETLWVMDLTSGKIRDVVKGYPKILELYGELIMEKVSPLKQMPCDLLQQQTEATCSPEVLSCAGLMSSFTTLQNHIIMCDIVGQQVLKLCRDSGICSNFQFSNFGILGLPYWMSVPLEKAFYFSGLQGTQADHVQTFRFLPGRIDIQLHIDLPMYTELLEPLESSSVWRQARGAAAVIPEEEDVLESSGKVSVAQKWYDELDNLFYEPPEPEEESPVEDDEPVSEVVKFDNQKLHISCAVNTSPGTSEAVICAPVYLKLKSHHPDLQEVNQKIFAEKIAEIMKPEKRGGMSRDSYIKLLLETKQDLRQLTFAKPLHVRIKFECPDHPKSEYNSKEIVVTNSSVEVNVSLAA